MCAGQEREVPYFTQARELIGRWRVGTPGPLLAPVHRLCGNAIGDGEPCHYWTVTGMGTATLFPSSASPGTRLL